MIYYILLFFFALPYTTADESIVDDFYFSRIEASRKAKNKKFKKKRSTPLKNYKQFSGHKYFPVDTNFIFLAELHKNTNPELIEFATSSGKARNYLAYATLTFLYLGETHHLTLFQGLDRTTQKPIVDYFFLPFTDWSSGDETYGGGRYIDIKELNGNQLFIDFNRAYNPYCAYEDGFSCPIPPKENALKMEITAGEKIYK